MIPAVFLGIAIVMSTAYVAFLIRDPAKTSPPEEGDEVRQNMGNRVRWLIDCMSQSVMHKRYALRSGVIALGFGVVFLPVAFLSFRSQGARAPTSSATQAWPA